MAKKIVWAKATCPICHQQFDYIEGGYKPKTCNNFDCIHKYLHRSKRVTELDELKLGRRLGK